jgi:hypothetical protein
VRVLSRAVHRTRWIVAHTTGTLACLAILLAFALRLGIAQVDADSDLALAASPKHEHPGPNSTRTRGARIALVEKVGQRRA